MRKQGCSRTCIQGCIQTCIIVVFLCVVFPTFAQNSPSTGGGREIPNTVAAVKAASPGDYIVLRSGRRYVLSAEEINIVNGRFNFEDLSGVRTEIRDDGTEIKYISEAHVVYIFPDGQSQHILKTVVSFSAYMEFLERKYHIARYIDAQANTHDYRTINSPRFDIFRASVQMQILSDGADEVEEVNVTAYNFRGRNFLMRFFSESGWTWGYVRDSGFRPTGETRQIEFDIE